MPSWLHSACLEGHAGQPWEPTGRPFLARSIAVSDHLIFLLLSSTAEAEKDRYFTAALASTHMYDPTTGNVTLALGIDQVELEELLWFFRREDRKSR